MVVNKIKLKLEDINKILELVKTNDKVINGDPINIIEKNYGGRGIYIDAELPITANNTAGMFRTSIATDRYYDDTYI